MNTHANAGKLLEYARMQCHRKPSKRFVADMIGWDRNQLAKAESGEIQPPEWALGALEDYYQRHGLAQQYKIAWLSDIDFIECSKTVIMRLQRLNDSLGTKIKEAMACFEDGRIDLHEGQALIQSGYKDACIDIARTATYMALQDYGYEETPPVVATTCGGVR